MDDLLVRFVSGVASCFLKLRFLASLTRQLLTTISPISNYPNVFAESRSTNKKLLQLNAVYLVAALALLFAGGASAVDIRVNAGGTQYTDSLGNVWSADTGYNTGNTASRPVAIANTTDDVLHHTQRWDPGAAPDLTYSFSIPNGDYAVTLHFAETYSGTSGVGLRVFDVQMEGALVMGKVDIFSEAGGSNMALSRTVPTIKVSDGYLDIKFLQQVENPTISAIEIHSVVSTSSVNRPESAYYILNPKFETGPLQVASLSDGNTITVGNTVLNLDQYQTGTVPAGVDLASGTLIQGAGPFSLGGEVNATDLPVPARFIGSQFVIPHNRGNHTYYILSPYGDAQVTATVGGVSTTVTALKGEVLTYDAGTVNGTSGLVQSDMPILISHTANAGVWDAYPVPPASKDLWGVRSNMADVGALEDNTSVTVYGSSGGTESFILNAGGFRALTIPSGSEGSGSAVHVVADKPIAAIQIADSDGIEATAFLSSAYLATNYVIPVNAQYIAVVCPDAGTMISLFSGSMQPVDMLCEGDGTTPGKTYFGSTTDGINIPAGAHLESTRPVYMYYESSATNDEHNILGHKEAYYVLNSRTQNAAVSVMSLVDNNRITAGSSEIFLNKYERGVIPAGSDLAPGAEIMGLGPFTLGADYNGTDMPVPAVFAANQFIIPHHRYSQTYAMLSPYGDADVDISLGSALPTTINLPQGQLVEFGAGSDTTISGLLQADRPILVVHKGNTSADVFPVAPAAMELWGLRSNTVALGALQDNTTATIFTSDGQSAVYNLDKGAKRTVSVGSTGDQGQGAAIHIVADKPVAAYQNADGDGSESTVFLSKQYLGTLYGIPVDAQYIAVVCPDANTTITLTDTGTSQQQSCSGSATYPGKVYFGSSTNGVQINAGATLSATNPVYVIYEASVTNDEHNLLGYTINVQAPLASAGGPYSGVAGSAITFDGSGSTDPDGDLLTYSWDFGDGVSTATGVTPSYSYVTGGIYTVSLTVSDGVTSSSASTATVTVSMANQPPTANVGGPYSGLAGSAIVFNGAGSSDPDTDPLTYSWDFGDGVGTGTGVNPTYSYAAAGNYAVTLTVNDGALNSTASASVNVQLVLPPTPFLVTVTNVGGDSYSVSGTAEPGIRVNIYANGQRVATTKADVSGNYSVTLSLAEGASTLYAAAENSSGESASSNTQLATLTLPTVGFTPGDFNVGPSGASTYSVPIAIPPGTAGVQPQVALVYNSQGGDGSAGMGWNLSAGSAITRCGQTLATNNLIKGINLDSGDRFCLNGQQLIAVNGGTYGANNTQYHTEIETYEKVVSYDTNSDLTPEYFVVWSKGGDIREYGLGQNSQQLVQLVVGGAIRTLAWHVSKISDRVNNYMRYYYTQQTATGEIYLNQIEYTGHDGAPTAAPYADVQFVYETRPDVRKQYIGGAYLESDQRLKTITVRNQLATVRKYNLSYQTAPVDSVSRLASLQECDALGDCLAATRFTWGTRSKGWSGTFEAPPVPAKGPWVIDNGSWFQYQQGQFIDVNGDGLTDFVQAYKTSDGASQRGTWINTSTGWVLDAGYALPADANIFGKWFRQTSGGNASWYQSQEGVFADVNADGLPDFVIAFNERLDLNGDLTQSVRKTYLNTGSGWVESPAYRSPVDLFGPFFKENGNFWEVHRGQILDVNGDGRVDIVYSWSGQNGPLTPANATTYLNTEPTGVTESSAWDGTSATAQNYRLPVALYGPWFKEDNIWYEYHQGQFGDVNGDGLADFVQAFTTIAGVQYRNTYLNTGAGWSVSPAQQPPAVLSSWYANTRNGFRKWNESQLGQIADINGDGLSDFVQAYEGGILATWDNCNCTTWLSTGKGFVQDSNYQLPAAMNGPSFQETNGGSQVHYSYSQSIFADVNSDGLPDYVRAVQFAGTTAQRLQTWVNTGRGWLADSAYTLPTPLFGNWVKDNGAWYQHIRGQLADVNGDGAVDFINAYQPIGTATTPVLYTYGNSRDHQPDSITRIVNGLGKDIQITYRPITDKTIYTPGSRNQSTETGTTFQGPMYVVANHRSSNGLGAGLAQVNYAFENGRVDPNGRGFLGFGKQIVTDTTSGNIITTNYRLDFPYTGSPISVEVTRTNGERLSYTSNLYTTVTASCGAATGARPYPYANQSTAMTYELGNPTTPVTTTVTQTNINVCGNADSVQVQTIGGGKTFTKTTLSSFTDITTNWVLGMLSGATTTHTATGAASKVRAVSFEYNASTGQVTAETIEPGTASELRTTHNYGAFGNEINSIVSGSGIASRQTSTAYDAGGRFAISSTNTLGHTENRVYDARFGLISSLTGPNGITTSWIYDNFGRKTTENRADGTRTTWAYVPYTSGNTRYYINETVLGSSPVLSYFDILDRPVLSRTTAMDGQLTYVNTDYDSQGRAYRVSRPYFSGDTQYWTTTTHDALERPILVTQADGGYVRTDYNGLTQTVYAFRNSRDGRGAIELKTTKVSDVMGNTLTVADHNNQSVSYAYDAISNLISSTDAANNTVIMGYDTRGNKTSMTDPDMGSWTYAYNVLGELVSQTDAKNQTTSMTYDLLGRMTSRSNAEGSSTWTYDSGFKAKGKLSSVSTTGATGNSAKSLSYDSLGRPSSVTDTIEGQTYTQLTSYDSLGRVNTQDYPAANGAFRTRNVYNANGYLTEVRNDLISKRYWRAESSNADGNVTQVTLDNGIVLNRNYRADTGLIDTIVTGGGGSIQNLKYVFDTLGNLERRDDLRAALIERFSYDNLNRVTSVQTTGIPNKAYQYDALGNITSKSDVGTYSYGAGSAGPHAVTSAGGKTYSYDANGNMTAGDGRSISWTSFNKPSAITGSSGTISMQYDADFKRIVKTEFNGSTVYVGGSYEKHTDGSIIRHRYFVRAGGQVIARVERQQDSGGWQIEQTEYLLRDHLGSVDTVVNTLGGTVERLSFDAYGKRRLANWQDGSVVSDFNHGYTGHEHDDEVALINMGGRLYDASLGRFISADPFIQSMDNMQALNRYSYVLNNPLSYTDPSGFFLKKLGRAIADSDIEENQLFQAVVTAAAAGACGPYAAACAGATSAAFAKGNGASWSDSLKTGAISAATIQVSAEISADGSWAQKGASFQVAGKEVFVRTVIAQGVVGGTASALQGGKFASGFASSSFSAAAAPAIPGLAGGDRIGQTVVAAIIGGTASELAGGKFANGASTAAFLFTLRELPSIYKSYVGYELDIGPGNKAVTKGELTRPIKGAINFGTQGGHKVDAQGRPINCAFPCMAEGGTLSRVINQLPLANAGAGVHDTMQISLGTGFARYALNVPGMVPAAGFTIGAALGQPLQLLTNQQLINLSVSNSFDRDDDRRNLFGVAANRVR